MTLGISFGTRVSGIAVVDQCDLVIKEVITINPRTNSHLRRISHYVTQFQIPVVVIKLPPETHISGQMQILICELETLLAGLGCTVTYITNKAIKALADDITNKYSVMRHASKHYPDLADDEKKELHNKNKYHIKMFEAVLAAHQHQLSTFN